MQKQIEIIQAYIFHRTGQEVKISKPLSWSHAFKLNSAYRTANEWLNSNGSIKFY